MLNRSLTNQILSLFDIKTEKKSFASNYNFSFKRGSHTPSCTLRNREISLQGEGANAQKEEKWDGLEHSRLFHWFQALPAWGRAGCIPTLESAEISRHPYYNSPFSVENSCLEVLLFLTKAPYFKKLWPILLDWGYETLELVTCHVAQGLFLSPLSPGFIYCRPCGESGVVGKGICGVASKI